LRNTFIADGLQKVANNQPPPFGTTQSSQWFEIPFRFPSGSRFPSPANLDISYVLGTSTIGGSGYCFASSNYGGSPANVAVSEAACPASDTADPLCEDNSPFSNSAYVLTGIGSAATNYMVNLNLPIIRARNTLGSSPVFTYYVNVEDLCGNLATVSFDQSGVGSGAVGNVVVVVPNTQAEEAQAAHDKRMSGIVNVAGSIGGVLLALAIIGIVVFVARGGLKQDKDTSGYAPAEEEV